MQISKGGVGRETSDRPGNVAGRSSSGRGRRREPEPSARPGGPVDEWSSPRRATRNRQRRGRVESRSNRPGRLGRFGPEEVGFGKTEGPSGQERFEPDRWARSDSDSVARLTPGSRRRSVKSMRGAAPDLRMMPIVRDKWEESPDQRSRTAARWSIPDASSRGRSRLGDHPRARTWGQVLARERWPEGPLLCHDRAGLTSQSSTSAPILLPASRPEPPRRDACHRRRALRLSARTPLSLTPSNIQHRNAPGARTPNSMLPVSLEGASSLR